MSERSKPRLQVGSVAERSKALVLGTSLFGGVGLNPTAAKNSFFCSGSVLRSLSILFRSSTTAYKVIYCLFLLSNVRELHCFTSSVLLPLDKICRLLDQHATLKWIICKIKILELISVLFAGTRVMQVLVLICTCVSSCVIQNQLER